MHYNIDFNTDDENPSRIETSDRIATLKDAKAEAAETLESLGDGHTADILRTYENGEVGTIRSFKLIDGKLAEQT